MLYTLRIDVLLLLRNAQIKSFYKRFINVYQSKI
jgi:hypothetical protein